MRTLLGLCLLSLLSLGLTQPSLAQESRTAESKPSEDAGLSANSLPANEAEPAKPCLRPEQADTVTGLWALTGQAHTAKPQATKKGLVHYHLRLHFDGCQLQSELTYVGLNGKALARKDWTQIPTQVSYLNPRLVQLELEANPHAEGPHLGSVSLALRKRNSEAATAALPTSYGIWHTVEAKDSPMSSGILKVRPLPETAQAPSRATVLSAPSCKVRPANNTDGETYYQVIHCGGVSADAVVLIVSPTFERIGGFFSASLPYKNGGDNPHSVNTITLTRVEILALRTSALVTIKTVFRNTQRIKGELKTNLVTIDSYQFQLMNGPYGIAEIGPPRPPPLPIR